MPTSSFFEGTAGRVLTWQLRLYLRLCQSPALLSLQCSVWDLSAWPKTDNVLSVELEFYSFMVWMGLRKKDDCHD